MWRYRRNSSDGLHSKVNLIYTHALVLLHTFTHLTIYCSISHLLFFSPTLERPAAVKPTIPGNQNKWNRCVLGRRRHVRLGCWLFRSFFFHKKKKIPFVDSVSVPYDLQWLLIIMMARRRRFFYLSVCFLFHLRLLFFPPFLPWMYRRFGPFVCVRVLVVLRRILVTKSCCLRREELDPFPLLSSSAINGSSSSSGRKCAYLNAPGWLIFRHARATRQ